MNNIHKTSMDSRWYDVIDHEWNAELCAKLDDKFNESLKLLLMMVSRLANQDENTIMEHSIRIRPIKFAVPTPTRHY